MEDEQDDGPGGYLGSLSNLINATSATIVPSPSRFSGYCLKVQGGCCKPKLIFVFFGSRGEISPQKGVTPGGSSTWSQKGLPDMKQFSTILACICIALSLPAVGCKKSADSGSAQGKASAQNTVTISGNDQMQFDKKTIKVKAGQKVKLTLKHSGSMNAQVMGHNFVLLKKGVDGADFASKAMAAKDQGYIPADLKGSVIANTKVLGGGESTTIEFVAPPAGTYTFLCSFPGHYAMMHGDFITE